MIWYLVVAGPGAALSVGATVLAGGRGLPVIGSAITGAIIAAITAGTAARGSYRSYVDPDRRVSLGRRERWILAAIGAVLVIGTGMLAVTFHGYD